MVAFEDVIREHDYGGEINPIVTFASLGVKLYPQKYYLELVFLAAVIGNSLSRNPKRGQVVARVNILASKGVQKNFEAKLIGAERSKDLAVLQVEAPTDLLRPMKIGQSSFLTVEDEFVETGYYKELVSINKEHHTTGNELWEKEK